MRFAAAIVIAGAGCKGLLGIDEGVVAIDAADDGPGPRDMAPACLGIAPNIVCPEFADMPLVITFDVQIDTSTCNGGHVDGDHDWCVLEGSSVQIAGTLAATGTRPLVILAAGALVVDANAMIDANSRHPVREPARPSASRGRMERRRRSEAVVVPEGRSTREAAPAAKETWGSTTVGRPPRCSRVRHHYARDARARVAARRTIRQESAVERCISSPVRRSRSREVSPRRALAAVEERRRKAVAAAVAAVA
jgi:hypothetical protein